MGTDYPTDSEKLAVDVDRRTDSTTGRGQLEALQSGFFDQRLLAARDVIETTAHESKPSSSRDLCRARP